MSDFEVRGAKLKQQLFNNKTIGFIYFNLLSQIINLNPASVNTSKFYIAYNYIFYLNIV
jgi:hypothetical protein